MSERPEQRLDDVDVTEAAAQLRAVVVQIDVEQLEASREQAAYLTGAADVLDRLARESTTH